MNSEKKILFTIEKTYKDFKNLYEKVLFLILKIFFWKNNEIFKKLKVFSHKKGIILEKLPDKGNIVNFMTKDCEMKIINHRKFALCVFMKYLIKGCEFKDCEDFINFLKF